MKVFSHGNYGDGFRQIVAAEVNGNGSTKPSTYCLNGYEMIQIR